MLSRRFFDGNVGAWRADEAPNIAMNQAAARRHPAAGYRERWPVFLYSSESQSQRLAAWCWSGRIVKCSKRRFRPTDDFKHIGDSPRLLPVKSGPIPFAVGPPNGLTSNSWRMWTSRHGDIYIACRNTFKEAKVSLHFIFFFVTCDRDFGGLVFVKLLGSGVFYLRILVQ